MNRRSFLKTTCVIGVAATIPVSTLEAKPIPSASNAPGVLALGPLRFVREWVVYVTEPTGDKYYMIRYDIMTKTSQWSLDMRYADLDKDKIKQARHIAEQMFTDSLARDGESPSKLIPIKHPADYKSPIRIAHLL